ncbi:MAG: hypothetical protein IJ733_08620 [Lachnospiraceae bacterium]|nr:hypothetical protein [Lachnospiraceae bacterium]
MKNGEFVFDESRDIIHNYRESIERHSKLILNSDYDYLDPEFIGEISKN